MADILLSRRTLAKELLAGTGIAWANVTAKAAQQAPAAHEDDRPQQLSAAESQLLWLLARFPSDHLTEEQRADIHRQLERRQIQSDILRQYPLEDTATSPTHFAAFRRDEE
jgi:hypothetical protein